MKFQYQNREEKFMPAKRNLKKSTRQKKLVRAIPQMRDEQLTLDGNSPKGKEAAIIRQFHLIQRGYAKLMNDVAKELDLVKGWISSQASMRKNTIKARIGSKLSQH